MTRVPTAPDRIQPRALLTPLLAILLTAALSQPLPLPAQTPAAGTGAGANTNSAAKAAAPKPKRERKGTKWDVMDHGPFFSSGVAGKHQTLKGLTIRVGSNATVCFDTELLRMSASWTGGFLTLPTGRDGLEGVPTIDGQVAFSTPRGPGWSKAGSFTDPRSPAAEDPKGRPVGPMPRDWAHWKGLYLHDQSVILSYSVGAADVLELPGFSPEGQVPVFTRTFQVASGSADLGLMVAEIPGAQLTPDGAWLSGQLPSANSASAESAEAVLAHLAQPAGRGAKWDVSQPGQLRLLAPGARAGDRLQIALWRGPATDLAKARAAIGKLAPAPSLTPLTKGGPARWTQLLRTSGTLGTNAGAYVVDTLPLPDENPWKSWIRCSGLDFFNGGTKAAICSVSGDVWIVDGIDDQLKNLTWKRYATGLFQPLGLKIVDEKVYITGRDQITRLHDLDGDGEADFYENFNNDITISDQYHEFVLNLETDSKGNFYFTKGGNLGEARLPHHGTLLRVPPDGSKLEVVSTGLRAPNGLGIGPNDEITTSDNEGNWVPSSRVNLDKPGGFFGHVFTAHRSPKPTTYDPPLFWLPHTYDLDNSSGGQVWATSDRWGPFNGHLLHTSYGACALFGVLLQTVDGVAQAATVKFPLKFDTGIMRGRVNRRDGQVYLTGLVVWQSKGPRQGAVHRVRYTGQPAHLPVAMKVLANRIEIEFSDPLDAASVNDVANYAVEQWNYKWTSNYGSPEFSVAEPDKKGRDQVAVRDVRLARDGKTVILEIPNLQPVMQMRIKYNLKSADGAPVASEIHNTINAVPKG